MHGRTRVALAAFACIAICVAGCSKEKGAKITGVVLENGQPLRLAAKERVSVSLVPTQPDEKGIKANPGAEFKPEDGTIVFVGPGQGLVPPGEYKVFAWDSVEPNAWLNEEFMLNFEDFGAAATVAPSQKLSAQLRLIPN